MGNYHNWKATKCPHRCLKVIKWVGFQGSTSHVDFAKDLLDIAVLLDTFIIDNTKHMLATQEDSTEPDDMWELARMAALQLKELRPWIEFVID